MLISMLLQLSLPDPRTVSMDNEYGPRSNLVYIVAYHPIYYLYHFSLSLDFLYTPIPLYYFCYTKISGKHHPSILCSCYFNLYLDILYTPTARREKATTVVMHTSNLLLRCLCLPYSTSTLICPING